ncbi:MAG: hypothetical protein HY652_12890, partial [Acidobacteria bacterium]|nr:hypothetical protein [Acidobacteriota bacterium]
VYPEEVSAFLDSVQFTRDDVPRLTDQLLHSIEIHGHEAVINLYTVPAQAVIEGVWARQEALNQQPLVKLATTSC